MSKPKLAPGQILPLTLFHYAKMDQWEAIKRTKHLEGRQALCWSYKEYERAQERPVFGLIEPEPHQWTNSSQWSRLMRSVGDLLLQYTLTDELVEQSFIVDWNLMTAPAKEISQREHGDVSANKLSLSDQYTKEKAYWGSRMPLIDYINSPERLGDYVLPEVVTFGKIPVEDVQVCDTQPKIKNMYPFQKDELLRLAEWYPKEYAPLLKHLD